MPAPSSGSRRATRSAFRSFVHAASAQTAGRALDWLCPRGCALCAAPGRALCARCRDDAVLDGDACASCSIPLPPGARGRRCGRCLKRPPAYDATVAATRYEAPFDQLVRGLKYGATLAHAPLFASLLARSAARRHDVDVDLLVPVPLSRRRIGERGFNQAIEIGRPLSMGLGVPFATDCILRIVDTAPQAALPFDARRRNVRGAFAVVDAARDRIAGRVVGVVDDVMTTGATVHELARTLKRAGAVRVVAFVVARTP